MIATTPKPYKCSQKDLSKAWDALSSIEFNCKINEYLYEFIPVINTVGKTGGTAYYYTCCQKKEGDPYTFTKPVKFASYSPLSPSSNNPSSSVVTIIGIVAVVVSVVALVAVSVWGFFTGGDKKSSSSSSSSRSFSSSVSVSKSSSSSVDQYLTTVKYKTIAPVTQRSLDDRITVSDIYYPTTTASSVLQKCE